MFTKSHETGFGSTSSSLPTFHLRLAGEALTDIVFLQALRARTMPSALSSREILALQSWRDPRSLQQNRLKSTAHEVRGRDDGTLPSALLYGGTKLSRADPKSQTQSSNEASIPSVNPPSQAQVVSYMEQHFQQSSSPQSSSQWRNRNEGFSKSTHKLSKRRAEQSPVPPPAQRLRGAVQSRFNGELKDEAYIRKNVSLPTAGEYPRLPPLLFSDLKVTLYSALQRVAMTRSEIVQLGRDGVFRCTLKCKFHVHEQSLDVMGEGRSKVVS